MVNTAQDILYLVLAFCILWVTVFFCWLLYHVVTVFRTITSFMREMEEKVHRIDDAMHGIKERIEHSVSHLGIIGDAMKHLSRYFLDTEKPDRSSRREK